MEVLIAYACRFLGGLYQSRVEPVAAAFDGALGPADLEEGRGGYAGRAAHLRARLAAMCAGYAGSPPTRADALDAYEAAEGLLRDLWRVAAADARAWSAARGPAAAAAYAQGALLRAAAPEPGAP